MDNNQNSKQVLFIAVGYQTTHLLYKLYSLFNIQHNIDLQGIKNQTNTSNNCVFQYSTLSRVYHIDKDSKYVPRCIFISLSQNTIQNQISQKQRIFFGKQNFVTIKGQNKDNFAHFYSNLSNSCFQQISKAIIQQTQKCQNLNGFKLFFNTSDGFGSGIGSKVLKYLKQNFPNKPIINYAINSDIENQQKFKKQTYQLNSCLAYSHIHQYSSICLTFDNKKLRNICQRQLQKINPGLQDINLLLTHHIWNLTSSLRYESCMLNDLSQYAQMLVLSSNSKYVISSYSPISKKKVEQIQEVPILDIFKSIYLQDLHLSNCDLSNGMNVAISCVYQGNVIPKHTGPTIQWAKHTKGIIRFNHYCPTGFKCGLFYNNPVYFPKQNLIRTDKSMSILSNNSSIVESFDKFSSNLNFLIKDKQLTFHYLKEGLQIYQFEKALQTFNLIQDQYQQWSRQNINPIIQEQE